MLGFVSLAVLALVADVSAQQGNRRRPGGQPGQGGPGGFGQRDPFQLPQSLGITDDQKAKLADLKKKYEDKLKSVSEKARLTEDQQAKMRDAFAKFRESGKDRSEFNAFLADELKLSDEQKKAREEQTALSAEIRKEIENLLTEEQKKKLEELRSNRGGRPQGGNRPERRKSE
jgi:Spy/CpxP family protein refolding chaperone